MAYGFDGDMNLIQKFHALLVSDKVSVWDYSQATPPLKRFVYWVHEELAALDPDDAEDHSEVRRGHGFDTLEEMIESAYAHIDPLRIPLPPSVENPVLQGAI